MAFAHARHGGGPGPGPRARPGARITPARRVFVCYLGIFAAFTRHPTVQALVQLAFFVESGWAVYQDTLRTRMSGFWALGALIFGMLGLWFYLYTRNSYGLRGNVWHVCVCLC